MIFVDDASDEVGKQHLEKTAASFPESVLVRTYRQRWFTRAVNLGLRLVRTPWAVELNSDCVLGEGWLEELYAVKDHFEGVGKKVGLVGSVYSANHPLRFQCTKFPDFVTGHCLLLNMQALQEVATTRNTPNVYLNESSPKTIHIFSDNEVCFDLNKLDYQTVMAFKSGVGHIAGKSWGHRLDRIPQRVEDVDFKWS